jgi:molybdopterin converting factor small subunit
VDGNDAEPATDPLGGGRGLAVVLLPSLLAAEADGRARFESDAATVEAALRALPVASLLLDERGALRPLVNVYVDGEDVRERDGLDTRLEGTEEIRVIAAIAGGEPRT